MRKKKVLKKKSRKTSLVSFALTCKDIRIVSKLMSDKDVVFRMIQVTKNIPKILTIIVSKDC